MRAALLAIVAAVLWSTGGLFIKIISLDAISLGAARSAIAAVTLFVIARALRIRVGLPRSAAAWFVAVDYALILLLFVAATKLTTSANAIFLQYTAPVYVLLLEPLLMKTKFKGRDLGFVAVALAGMSLFFVGRMEAGDKLGNALALASGVCFALFTVVMRYRKGDDGARWEAVVHGNALLAIGVALYTTLSPTAAFGWPSGGKEIAGILFLGIVQIGIAYAFFAQAISKISALEATLLCMLEPLLNPVWVFLGTGERPSNWALLGAVIIIGTIAFRSWLEANDSGPGAREDLDASPPAPVT